MGGEDVRKLRKEMKLSQPAFASCFGLNLGTLRQWEQDQRAPDAAARVLLSIISHSPDVVMRVIGATSSV